MLRRVCCACLGLASLSTGFLLPPTLPSVATSMRSPASRGVMRLEAGREGGVQKGGAASLARNLLPFTVTTFLSFTAPMVMQPPSPALADGATTRFSLPPIDQADKSRCRFRSSSMGQANAARDKLYDLRLCDLSGQKADGFDLSGAILAEANFEKTTFKETILSKAYAKASNFEGADFSNAVVDRVSFEGAKLKGALFTNAVLSGTSFNNADLTDVDFTDSYLGEFDLKSLCRNPTLQGTNPVTGASTKESAGCK